VEYRQNYQKYGINIISLYCFGGSEKFQPSDEDVSVQDSASPVLDVILISRHFDIKQILPK